MLDIDGVSEAPMAPPRPRLGTPCRKPRGIGGGEFIYGELYKMLGFPFAAGVLGSLMQRCINWALGLVGYLVYLRMKPGLVKVALPRKEIEHRSLATICECGR